METKTQSKMAYSKPTVADTQVFANKCFATSLIPLELLEGQAWDEEE